jgi:SAM-dependent methyltransferase
MQPYKSNDTLNYCNEYYKQPYFWDIPLSNQEKKRLSVTLSLVPQNVETILDVGCGDGRITNELAHKYNIIGMDISREALRHVKMRKVLAKIEQIPFQKQSFDLILCTEVIEHLHDTILCKAIREIERVSKKYIFLTVPFKENLYAGMTKCNNCGEEFHIFNHFQSFSPKRLASLFPSFRPVNLIPLGSDREYNNKLLLFLIRKLGFKWNGNRRALCPRCGNQDTGTQGNIFGWVFERIHWRIGSIYPFKRKSWIGVLYEKVVQ